MAIEIFFETEVRLRSFSWALASFSLARAGLFLFAPSVAPSMMDICNEFWCKSLSRFSDEIERENDDFCSFHQDLHNYRIRSSLKIKLAWPMGQGS